MLRTITIILHLSEYIRLSKLIYFHRLIISPLIICETLPGALVPVIFSRLRDILMS